MKYFVKSNGDLFAFNFIFASRSRCPGARSVLLIDWPAWMYDGYRRCNAKYLWKRIPPDVKAAHEELGRVWMVGQCMWQRNWSAVHTALNVEWSEDIKDVMTALKGKSIRQKIMLIINLGLIKQTFNSFRQN